MADLFTRLADMGGVPGAITPRVLPLFAVDAAQPDPGATTDDHEQPIVPSPGTAAAAAPLPAVSPRPPAATPITPGPPAAPPSSVVRSEHPRPPARVEPEPDTARLDRAVRRLETTARQAEGVDTGRLRPRPDTVVTPPAMTQTRAEQRSGAQAADRRGTRAEAVTATATAPPTVNISIGRIEVRAIPAPPPPAAVVADRRGEPHGLTLAQYLRGDDGRPR